ncbi:MAG: hypothetical protein DRJ96_06365 [Thermoprotei archaeon]|nr:MAG: hypothetical protein DRJ96_06365 [Thermoprotei archaeon]
MRLTSGSGLQEESSPVYVVVAELEHHYAEEERCCRCGGKRDEVWSARGIALKSAFRQAM